jgi:hypothetical protein
MGRGRIPAIMQAISPLLNGRICESPAFAVADTAFA